MDRLARYEKGIFADVKEQGSGTDVEPVFLAAVGAALRGLSSRLGHLSAK